jgi:tRNA dimethylallyltransferase
MNKLLIRCGLTDTGKTSFAMRVGSTLGGNIISADSRQVYKGMDIVPGKDLDSFFREESGILWNGGYLDYYTNGAINVWLTDIVYPNEEFNVSFFRKAAFRVIDNLQFKSILPIVVGGTGLYISSLVNEFDALDIPPSPRLREELKNKTVPQLQEILSANNRQTLLDMNQSDKLNPRRLIRAIEVAKGITKSEENKESKFDTLTIGFTLPKEIIEERISTRIQKRIEQGAVSETKRLINKGYSWEYSSLNKYLSGELDLNEAVADWRAKEISYAKRQMTWFKKMGSIHWFDVSSDDYLLRAEKLIYEWYN